MIVIRCGRLELLVAALTECHSRTDRTRNPVLGMFPSNVNQQIWFLARRMVATWTRKDRRINHVCMNLVHVLCKSAFLDEALAATGHGACMFDFTTMLQDMIIHRVCAGLGYSAFWADIESCLILRVLGCHSYCTG